jgi:hypothetical protein
MIPCRKSASQAQPSGPCQMIMKENGMKQSTKKILKRTHTVKIIVTLIYSEKRPMEKAFTDYLCQQLQKKID